jgi:hypothetical protein
MHWESIAFWLFMTVVVVAVVWVAHLRRAESEKTIRQAIERGVAIDSDLIDKLRQASSLSWRQRLIGWGIVTLFLSGGVAAFALFLPEPQSVGPLLGIAAFFAFIGLGLTVCGVWLGKSGEV